METCVEKPKIFEVLPIHLHPIPFRIFPILIQWCQVPPQLPSVPAPVEAQGPAEEAQCGFESLCIRIEETQEYIYIYNF